MGLWGGPLPWFLSHIHNNYVSISLQSTRVKFFQISVLYFLSSEFAVCVKNLFVQDVVANFSTNWESQWNAEGCRRKRWSNITAVFSVNKDVRILV